LEALSRGAASVVFIERQRLAAEALRNLLRDWQAVGARVVCGQARQFLEGHDAERFDLVFLDPPFAASSDGGELAAAVSALAGWLTRDARIYVEHAKSDPPLALGDAWRELRTGTAGEVRYHLLAAASEGGVGPA
jgi:16S rRNA (guanine966-N2)-methyltransferase